MSDCATPEPSELARSVAGRSSLHRIVQPSRPKALDLFCGAGGAGVGLHRAGFDVTGVDIKHQRRYPFAFLLGDALDADLSGFDFVWASPPCQRYTVSQNASKNRDAHPDLIAPIRAKLQAWGGPWIIENVVGAPLLNPVTLCGLALGLNVKRHRRFESNQKLVGSGCGDHNRDYYLLQGREVRCRVRMGADPKGTRCGLRVATDIGRKAMGIDWMTRAEMSEAIPPAYSEFLARQITCGVTARLNIQAQPHSPAAITPMTLELQDATTKPAAPELRSGVVISRARHRLNEAHLG